MHLLNMIQECGFPSDYLATMGASVGTLLVVPHVFLVSLFRCEFLMANVTIQEFSCVLTAMIIQTMPFFECLVTDVTNV